MQSRHTKPLSVVLIAVSVLAACAGGGGGGAAGMIAEGAPVPPLPPPSYSAWPTTTTLSTPNFADPRPAVFPLLFTGYAWKGGRWAPMSGTGATLTLTLGAPPDAAQGPHAVSWQISVPSVGVTASGWETAGLYKNFDSPIQTLDYVAFGSWQWGSAMPSQDIGHFVFGYETAPASMPVSGTAAFSGVWEGEVFTATAGQPIQTGDIGGDASFSVDFLSGKISGALTAATSGGSYGIELQPWNNVSVSAAIGAGSNHFTGTTAVSSSPANGTGLNASARGTIAGAFYGPSAAELGAVWTLNDGISNAIGTVVARH